MNWNRWIRQTHRWFSMVFTAAVIFDTVMVAMGRYANWMGFVPLAPLAVLFFSGLYLFVLPYAPKRRNARSTG